MNILLRALEGLNALVARLLDVAIGALLAAMATLVVASVFLRYVLNSSLTWSEELTRYLDAWLVFLGLSVAHRMGAHVRITLLLDLTPSRYRRYIHAFSEVVLFVLLVAVAILGAQLVLSNFDRNQLTPALRIPIAWVYLSVPVGLGLMALQALERVFRLLAGRELHPPAEELDAEQDAAG